MRVAANYKLKVLDYKKEPLIEFNMKNYIHQVYMSYIPREAPLLYFIISKKRSASNFETKLDKASTKSNYLMVNAINLANIKEDSLNISKNCAPKQESLAPINFYNLKSKKNVPTKKQQPKIEKPVSKQAPTKQNNPKKVSKSTKNKSKLFKLKKSFVSLKKLDDKEINALKQKQKVLNEIVILD